MLHTEIDNMIADAMKQRSDTLEILKLIKCEFVKAQKDGVKLDEVTEAQILMRMVNQHEDSIAQFTAAGRSDLVDNEKKELEVIKSFAPAQPTDEEVAEYTSGCITAYVLTQIPGYKLSMKDMRPIMQLVHEKYPTAPGKIISKTLQQILK